MATYDHYCVMLDTPIGEKNVFRFLWCSHSSVLSWCLYFSLVASCLVHIRVSPRGPYRPLWFCEICVICVMCNRLIWLQTILCCWTLAAARQSISTQGASLLARHDHTALITLLLLSSHTAAAALISHRPHNTAAAAFGVLFLLVTLLSSRSCSRNDASCRAAR